ncbi:unnamed protein product, partial [Rotaria sp. Silwood1]
YSITSYSLITTKRQVIWNEIMSDNSSNSFKIDQDGIGFGNWTAIRNIIDWVDNDAYGTVAFILTIIFVCIANVLLLNVLIAVFNVTLNKVQDHAHTSWAFQRLLLVNEYSRKSPLPPPFNLIHYICKGLWKIFNSCRKENFNNNIYGSLDNSSGLDCNLYDTILFNAIDQVKICGYVTEVSVNFSTKPTANQPKIWLFTIQNTNIGTHPNTFQIIEKKMIPLADIQLESGIQTFTQLHIPIRAKQYLAIRFSTGSGNPFSTEHGSQQCQCHAHINQKTAKMKINQKQTKQNLFRIHDNILREQSIAQSYWATIINSIKKEEKDKNKQQSLEEN